MPASNCRRRSFAAIRRARRRHRTSATWSSPRASTWPGVVDNGGNPGRVPRWANPASSGEPQYDGVGDPNNDYVLDAVEVPVGPDTGGTVVRWRRLRRGRRPARTGAAVAEWAGPGAQCGFQPSRRSGPSAISPASSTASPMNCVRAGGSTTFDAAMVVPTGLIAPVMKIDACVGNFDTRWVLRRRAACTRSTAARGWRRPATRACRRCIRRCWRGAVLRGARLPRQRHRTVHAIGLEPRWPGDRQRREARRATTCISNEEVVRFRQYSTDICTGVPLVNVFYADFDGNGRATAPFVCPAGPGQITRIPR